MAMSEKAKRILHVIDITREVKSWIESVEAGTALGAGVILLQHLAVGILAATDEARNKIAAGFFAAANAISEAHFADGFWRNAIVAKFADGLFAANTASRAKFADGIWTSVKLAFEPVTDLMRNSFGWIRFSGGAAASGETVTIGARVYELVNTAGLPGTGDVIVDMQAAGHGAGPWAAADCATELVAAINADVGAEVQARVDTGGSMALLVGLDVTTAHALATTVAGAIRSAATMVVGQAAGDRYVKTNPYAVTAADVTTWAAGGEVPIATMADPGSAPNLAYVQWLGTADDFGSNAGMIAHVEQFDANSYAVLFRDPTATIVAGSVINSGMIA